MAGLLLKERGVPLPTWNMMKTVIKWALNGFGREKKERRRRIIVTCFVDSPTEGFDSALKTFVSKEMESYQEKKFAQDRSFIMVLYTESFPESFFVCGSSFFFGWQMMVFHYRLMTIPVSRANLD